MLQKGISHVMIN